MKTPEAAESVAALLEEKQEEGIRTDPTREVQEPHLTSKESGPLAPTKELGDPHPQAPLAPTKELEDPHPQEEQTECLLEVVAPVVFAVECDGLTARESV